DAGPDRLYARTDEMVDSQETGTHRETPRPVRPPQARGGQQIRPATGEAAIYLPYRRRVEVAGYQLRLVSREGLAPGQQAVHLTSSPRRRLAKRTMERVVDVDHSEVQGRGTDDNAN